MVQLVLRKDWDSIASSCCASRTLAMMQLWMCLGCLGKIEEVVVVVEDAFVAVGTAVTVHSIAQMFMG